MSLTERIKSTMTGHSIPPQLDRSLDFAGCSLSLLQFSNARRLQEYFTGNPQIIESSGGDLFDSNGQMVPEFVEFAERAIEHYQELRKEGTQSAG